MAEFNVSGLGELAKQLEKMGQSFNDELIGEMFDAGAEVVAEEWRKGIKRTVRTNRSTGELEKSVAPVKGFKRDGGAPQKEIYPQGKDSKGVRNAEKAFILHYGKSGQPATRFVDEVEDRADGPAAEAMEEVFNDFIERQGL